MKTFVWFVPSILVVLGILILSTFLSVPMQVEGVGYLDKLQHAFAYLVLVVSLGIGFHKTGLLTTKVWVLIITACIAYGTLLEWIQYTFFPNRYFEWMDALANTIGVLLGSISFRIFKK